MSSTSKMNESDHLSVILCLIIGMKHLNGGQLFNKIKKLDIIKSNQDKYHLK